MKKNITLLVLLVCSLVWSQQTFAKTAKKKSHYVGQKYAKPHGQKHRSVSSASTKKKKPKKNKKHSAARGHAKKKKNRNY